MSQTGESDRNEQVGLSIEQLENMVDKANRLLEQSNKEKQQWKQCAHTLADALEETFNEVKEERRVSFESYAKMNDALKQFKKLRDQ